MKTILSLALVLLLAGCATQPAGDIVIPKPPPVEYGPTGANN